MTFRMRQSPDRSTVPRSTLQTLVARPRSRLCKVLTRETPCANVGDQLPSFWSVIWKSNNGNDGNNDLEHEEKKLEDTNQVIESKESEEETKEDSANRKEKMKMEESEDIDVNEDLSEKKISEDSMEDKVKRKHTYNMLGLRQAHLVEQNVSAGKKRRGKPRNISVSANKGLRSGSPSVAAKTAGLSDICKYYSFKRRGVRKPTLR